MFAGIAFEHSERRNSMEDVCVGEGGLLGNVVDRHVFCHTQQEFDNDLGPVGAVTEQAQVGERLLWTAELLLDLRQLVGELDEELPVSVPLVLGESEDTRDVVALR